jgi:fatty acid desaturase
MNILSTRTPAVATQGKQLPDALSEPVQTLYRGAPLRFAGKVLSLLALLGLSAYIVQTQQGWLRFLAQVCIAGLLAHGTELVHQCLHKTGTHIASVDRAIGTILGFTTLLSFSHYQYWHFHHHKHNGSEKDRESFGYAYPMMLSKRRLVRVFGAVVHLSMVFYFYQTLQRAILGCTGRLARSTTSIEFGPPPTVAKTIQREYAAIGVILLCVIATVVFGLTTALNVWLIPLIVWAPIHALIELPEHFHCDHPHRGERNNTRSIRAGQFMAWFTNGNCFHVGHHENMRVPMHNLRKYEEMLRKDEAFKHEEESYFCFFRRLALYILRGHW